MKITSVRLKNFKRFTDLTLIGIPANTKLVLLIGNNGSGKSSVFDAFEAVARIKKGSSQQHNATFQTIDRNDYYQKIKNQPQEIIITRDSGIQYYMKGDGVIGVHHPDQNSFYGRTSFRQIPLLTRRYLGNVKFNVQKDDDRPALFIERDNRFENDIEKISGNILDEVFEKDQETKSIRGKYIEPINKAFINIFGSNAGITIKLTKISPPLEGNVAKLLFQKGNTIFHYNQLSAGEKEIFNILLDLIARREYFQDTVYFFDEIDLHLNTKLQYNFIKELIENWIPDNCQFWTASHSLGFIQYAKETEEATIFDFNDLDFDYAKTLVPQSKDNPDLYEIAVNKELLPALFKDYKIYFVENKDKSYYSALNIPNVLFVQSTNKKSVYHKTKNGDFNGIVDRDFLTDNDISEIEKQYQKLKILKFYSIENYLYHPENLKEYYNSKSLPFDLDEYVKNLTSEKELKKNEIIRGLALVRTGYSFFEEPEQNGSKNQKRFKNDGENLAQVVELEKYLNSNNFEDFYKVFPMKDFATQLKQRQNISKSELAKTNWFKIQIENIII